MTQPDLAPTDPTPRIMKVLWAMAAATAAITPLVITPGSFAIYRVGKDAAFLSLGLLLAALVIGAAFTMRDRGWLTRVPAIPAMLAAAAVVWSAVTAMTSQRPAVSLQKPLTVFAMAAFFVAAMIAARRWRLLAVAIGLVPVLVNSVVAILQSTNVWSPWPVLLEPALERLKTTAFLGNPNEVGTYL